VFSRIWPGSSKPKKRFVLRSLLPPFLSPDWPFVPQLLMMILTWAVLLVDSLAAHGAAR